MLKAIPSALCRHQYSKIEFPDEIKMVEWAHMIERREPMAKDVIGFMDGLSLHSECNSNTYEQNAMYNGYHADTMVNNVFAYGADGKVFLCGLNFPGRQLQLAPMNLIIVPGMMPRPPRAPPSCSSDLLPCRA